ncbi:MAG: heavy-metal-associated domain-containing protein [Bdellovibrionaceae bacterium]|nr:heavy-metal-associated domain-containing protein [Pseudobdellovibrionaceae bacterium]
MRFLSVALVVLVMPFSTLAETKTYTLEGMTCQSCVKSVKAQVCKIPGLDTCEVELNKVTLSGKTLDEKLIESAITKAGYSILPKKAHH